MKPAFLSIKGINSIKELQQINFEDLYADNMFCIYGATGSGKTTILDSIILALYGEGKRSDTISEYVNLSVDKGEIVLRFYCEDNLYEVNRTFSIKGSNKAYLYNVTTDQMLADQPDKVSSCVRQLLGGLSRAEFTQVVILEQGKFSRFLTAEKAKRSSTISQLFSLSRFENLGKSFNLLRDKFDNELKVINAKMEQYAFVTVQKKSELIKEKSEAEKRINAHKKALKICEEKLLSLSCQREQFNNGLLLKEKLQGCKTLLEARIAQLQQLKQKSLELDSTKAKVLAAKEEFVNAQNYVENLSIIKKEALQIDKLVLQRGTLLSDYSISEKQRLEYLEKKEAVRKKGEAIQAEKSSFIKAAAQKKLECEQRLEAVKKEIQNARVELENAQNAYMATHLAHGLKEGDVCPVCFSTVGTRLASEGGETTQHKAHLQKLEEQQAALELLLSDSVKESELKKEVLEESIIQNQTQLEKLSTAEQRQGFESEKIVQRGKHIYEELCRWVQSCAERMGNQGEPSPKLNVENIDKEIAKIKANIESTLLAVQEQAQKLKEFIASSESEASDVGEQLSKMQSEISVLEGKCRVYEADLKKLATIKFDPAELSYASKQKEELEAQLSVDTALRATLEQSLLRIGEGEAVLKTLTSEQKSVQKKLDNAAYLASLLRGNRFLEYIEEEYIHKFTLAASEIMFSLSGGKYSLEYIEEDKKSGFYVTDYLAEGQKRKVKTLSGGETFLASISLAMSISQQIAFSKQFDFFFLDEGFGTLDETTIATVIEALRQLSQQVMVGLVSHRSELIERVPAKIKVTPPSSEQGSLIEIENL